jgi:hypothetical protein
MGDALGGLLHQSVVDLSTKDIAYEPFRLCKSEGRASLNLGHDSIPRLGQCAGVGNHFIDEANVEGEASIEQPACGE